MQIEYAEGMDRKDKRAIKKQIRYLKRGSKTFRKIWKDLKRSNHIHTIHSGSSDDNHIMAQNGDYLEGGNSSDIYLHPTENTAGFEHEAVVAHEMGHAWRIDRGLEPEREGANGSSTIEDIIYQYKHKQYTEFEGTHIENIIRFELGLPHREEYGEVSDNHTGNTRTLFGNTMLDHSKTKLLMIGKDKNYDYNGSNHYENLQKRTRTKKSFQLNKYTDAAKYN